MPSSHYSVFVIYVSLTSWMCFFFFIAVFLLRIWSEGFQILIGVEPLVQILPKLSG